PSSPFSCSHVRPPASHSFPTRRSSDLIIEERVFTLKRKNILREGYVIKRKASSYRKIFKFTQDIFNKIPTELDIPQRDLAQVREDRKSTRLNSSHVKISYAVVCLKKKN